MQCQQDCIESVNGLPCALSFMCGATVDLHAHVQDLMLVFLCVRSLYDIRRLSSLRLFSHLCFTRHQQSEVKLCTCYRHRVPIIAQGFLSGHSTPTVFQLCIKALGHVKHKTHLQTDSTMQPPENITPLLETW